MFKYKVIAIVLVGMLMLGGCTSNDAAAPSATASTATAQPVSSPTAGGEYSDTELKRAVNFGIGEWREDDPQVTFSEFFTMLDRVIELADSSKLDGWQAEFTAAHTSNDAMTRYDGMLAVFYAAQTLGDEYLEYNENDFWELYDRIGDWDCVCNETIFGNMQQLIDQIVDVNYAYDESWVCSDNIPTMAYQYSFGRISLFSEKTVFDYSEEENSMRNTDPFLYEEALLAALRLHDSVMPEDTERTASSESDMVILNAADARKEAILNSPTTVEVQGTSYYVSNNGSDDNDGLTPETAWATLDKVNSACTEDWSRGDDRWNNDRFPEFLWASEHRDERISLEAGDCAFFERGGLWRGVLRSVPGVTYSAYGEGEKPRIYGSPENGSGAEKWSLLDGTDNIWVFYKDLQDCGGILLGEDTAAVKQTAFLFEDVYYYIGDGILPDSSIDDASPFDISTLGNLRFFNDIHYPDNGDGSISYGEWGKLYLCCDAGNPGAVYSSIEFFTGNNDWNGGLITAESDCVIDNLCARFGAQGISAHYSNSQNVTIQNCEVGWIGGMIGGYDGTVLGDYNQFAIVRYGDGIMLGGKDNRAVNNYIYQTYDWAITVEGFITGTESAKELDAMLRENCVIEGNLAVKCCGGAIVTGWYAYSTNIEAPLFSNITIDKNIFMNCGEGGWAHLEDKTITYLADVGVFLNPGCENIDVSDNIFYVTRAENSLVHIAGTEDEQNEIHFSGNIYAQNDYGYLICEEEPGENGVTNYYLTNLTADQDVEEVLGDTTGFVFPLKDMPASFSLQELTEKANAILTSSGSTTMHPK